MDLNLRLLRYLVAVVDAGHFGHAAKSLYISAPTLTQQIRKLEAQVHLTLLDRGSHPVKPTAEGRAFIEAARTVLAAAEQATAIAATTARQRDRRFTIGFVLGFVGPLNRPILDGFAAAAPQVTLELVELAFAEQVSAVIRGQVDASFIRGPMQATAAVRLDRVLREPRVLAVPSDHRFAQRPSVRITEVGDEPQAKIADDVVDPAWSRWWAADPRPDGSSPNYGPSLHTMTEFLEQIASTRAVGITTMSLATQYPRSDIAYIQIEDIPEAEVFLCTRADDDSPLVTALREISRKTPQPYSTRETSAHADRAM